MTDTVTFEKSVLTNTVREIIVDLFKSGDDSIVSLYEDILLGKIIEQNTDCEFDSMDNVYSILENKK